MRTSIGIGKAWGPNLLAKGIYHMRDKGDIDTKSYFITISLKKSEYAEGIAKRFYDEVVHLLNINQKSKTPLHRLPTIIAGADSTYPLYDETRTFKSNPHVHLFLILPKSGSSLTNDEVEFLRDKFTSMPAVHKFKSEKSASVDIRKFDIARPEGGPLVFNKIANVINYCIKANAGDDLPAEQILEKVWIYPYDDLQHKHEKSDDDNIKILEDSIKQVSSRHKYFLKRSALD